MRSRISFAVVFVVSSALVTLVHAGRQAQQGGDQFLDGIGETGLVARYVLNDNAEDSSRNQFHAALRGTGGAFVEDAQFRRVLLLTGDGSHVQLPGQTLAGEDTISVTGWLFLPTGASGPVFDFGQNAANRTVRRRRAGRASARRSSSTARCAARRPPSRSLENQWMHFAVVLDPAGRVLTTYLDGARAGQATDVDRERRADRQPDGRRSQPALPRPLAGRRRRRRCTAGCATSASIASR